MPSSFELNFAAINPDTRRPYSAYSFPYFSSYFQAPSQLICLETRVDPFSNTRDYDSLGDYFRHPTALSLDYFSPAEIKQHIYFISGETFSSQFHNDQHVDHIGFFLLHIISAKMLVPISNTMTLALLERGLPGDPSLWSTLLHDMKDFSDILHDYFTDNRFYLHGPFPSTYDDGPTYLLRFDTPTDGDFMEPHRNFYVPDNFFHPDPVKKWSVIWATWYFHQKHTDISLRRSPYFQDASFPLRWEQAAAGPFFPTHDPFHRRDILDNKRAGRFPAGRDGITKQQLEDPTDPLHPLHAIINDYDFFCTNHINFGRYWWDQIPPRYKHTKIAIFPQAEKHKASVATEVTPSPTLSSITQALPNLSPEDLRALQTDISNLLPPPEETEDFDKKPAALPTLPEVDLVENLSLGSLDNDDNINNETFDHYLQSHVFKPFSPNIPFSLVTKQNSPPSLTTGSLRTLHTDHHHQLKTLGTISTPRTVSFDTTFNTSHFFHGYS